MSCMLTQDLIDNNLRHNYNQKTIFLYVDLRRINLLTPTSMLHDHSQVTYPTYVAIISLTSMTLMHPHAHISSCHPSYVPMLIILSY